MSRRVEIIFLRHGDKSGDALSEAGKQQAYERGRSIEMGRGRRKGTSHQRGVATEVTASVRNRTEQTALEIVRGMTVEGGRVAYLGKDPRLTFHIPTYEEEYDAKVRFSADILKAMARIEKETMKRLEAKGIPADLAKKAAKTAGNEVSFQMWMEGAFSKGEGRTAERGGAEVAQMVTKGYHEAQREGPPLRHVFTTHGGSVAEATFYAMTGINPSEVKKKGTFGFTEPWKLVIEGKKMHAELRGKRFAVQPAWNGILRKLNPTRQNAAIEAHIRTMEMARKARVKRKLRNPKRKTLRH